VIAVKKVSKVKGIMAAKRVVKVVVEVAVKKV